MHHIQTTRALPLIVVVITVTGCGETAPPPRSAIFFEGDPVALESKLIDCQADPQLSSEDPECRNARIAANRIAAAEEVLRKARLEAEFERKRRAIRERRSLESEAAAAAKAALRAEAEAKLDRGEYLTIEEAEAIGVDPTNPAIVRQPDTDGDVPQGEAGSSGEADGGETEPGTAFELPVLEPGGSGSERQGAAGAAGATGERPDDGPRDLSEIRDALDDETQPDDNDGG